MILCGIFCLLSSITIANETTTEGKKDQADPEKPCTKTASVNWTASYFCSNTNTLMAQSSTSSCSSTSTVSCEDAQEKANTCAAALAVSAKATAVSVMTSLCNPPLN